MELEPGRYFIENHKRLDSITDIEAEWASALDACKNHIQYRLKKRTSFGAHTATRLGENPIDYYVSYAYDAILSGRWEWKKEFTLAQQLIRIADSTISTEVEKTKTAKALDGEGGVIYDDMDLRFYDQDPLPDSFELGKEILIDKQILVIEEAIKGDADLEFFWECVKEKMKRDAIASLMEKTPKQLDKLRERFIRKIKSSPYFEMEE